MSYRRVIPRDLFNEADLLKCLGQLWIKLDERRDHRAQIFHGDAGSWQIEQDPSDGSISCRNIEFSIGDFRASLCRPLNSREKWPLYARQRDEEWRVFDLDGELSPEFWGAISG